MERRSAGAVVPVVSKEEDAITKSKILFGRENAADNKDSSTPGILRSTSKSTFYRPSRIRFPPIKPVNTVAANTNPHRVHFETDDQENKKRLRANKFADWSVKASVRRFLTQLLLVSLALIAFDKRHLVLQIPRIGFALYALFGGPFPPYVDDQIFDYHEQWLQSGDVLISAPPKSGMTWMMYTLYRLRELDEFNNNCAVSSDDELDINTMVEQPIINQHLAKSTTTITKPKAKFHSEDNSVVESKKSRDHSINKQSIREIIEVSEIGPPQKMFGLGKVQDQSLAKQISTTTTLDRAKVRTDIQSAPNSFKYHSTKLKDDIKILMDDRFKQSDETTKTASPAMTDEIFIKAKYLNHFEMGQQQEMLRRNNNGKQIRDIYEEVRWTEFVYYPGQSIKERIEILKFPSSGDKFRIFKSHGHPPRVPLRHDVKYIVLARNPLDAIESAKDFIRSHHPLFSKMWGGFPILEDFPKSLWGAIISTEMFLHFFILNFFKSWWDIRRNENVLMVHYSDRIQNDTTELTRIARHLNLNVSKAQLSRLAKELTFENIVQSDKASIFHLDHMLDPFKLRNLVDKDVFVLDGHNAKAMLSKGPKRQQTGGTDAEEELRFKLSLENAIRRYLEDDDAFSWLVR